MTQITQHESACNRRRHAERDRYVREHELFDLIAALEEVTDELSWRPKVTDDLFATLKRTVDYLYELRETSL